MHMKQLGARLNGDTAAVWKCNVPVDRALYRGVAGARRRIPSDLPPAGEAHLCEFVRANDANIRAALIDRFGPGKDKAVGRKATPGPLFGLKGDEWSALAIALTAHEPASG
jgi:hypothetical protein